MEHILIQVGMLHPAILQKELLQVRFSVDFQKQRPELFCKKRFGLKIRKFHRKAPVMESLF